MSKAVSSNKKPQKPGSSKNPPPTHDKKKDTAVVNSVSELQKENDALKFRIECLEKQFNPKVFEKKAGQSEQTVKTLFEDALKSAEETIVKLRNGNSSDENTGELKKAKDEIKELTNKLNQMAKAEETLKLDLQTAQSERDDLKKQLSEARSTTVSEKKTSTGSQTSAENEAEKADSSEQAFTEKLNKANEEIKNLNNMLKQKETECENLKRELEKAQSKLDNLQKKQTDARRSSDEVESSTIATLKEDLKKSEKEIDRLKADLKTANENKDTETASLKKQVEDLKTTTHKSSDPNDTKKLQEQLDQNKQQMDQQASELKIVKKDLEMKKEEILGLQDEKKSIVSELTKLKSLNESQNNDSMKEQITEKDTEIGNKKSEIDALKVEIKDLKKTIDALRREKTMEKTAPPGRDDVGDIRQQLSKATHEIDELKSRLSKMVGENLTNNNPNITDLSDENRPTKLAEIYSEMYDNEWTDAFEELEKQGSKELNIISDLLKILQDTLKFCGKLAEQYIANLQKSASKLHDKTSTTNQYQKLHLLKELRKSYAPSLADEVFSLYVKEKNLKFGKTPKVEAYTRSCVKLSWLMSVQDPAVVIDEVKTPSKFDGDRYRAYTQSGTTMEFVVWPTMLIHSGGPILMKGVAQCK
ncbi:myosin heavy chain, fast skeletal muscle-like isoform X2 [Dreissena polymorpha]|uniref:myosin heavy chain, fast skeletal muscle-like isoform X2 n=1 Tax=Dreissena polymorpha TaxID=45954 RepID=UPI002263C99E|nr:myosin heavy chain, fast skeletal muscle-like isoform X2 [Dreissena polymorpha]